MKQTPNFRGWHAVILHRGDSNTDRLKRQLGLLGLTSEVNWAPMDGADTPDVVFVDADHGWEALLPWSTSDQAQCPVVALLGTEAPSRIAWAMSVGAGAILAKPLSTSAVYPAMVMAVAIHEERTHIKERIVQLEERIRMRPLVHKAVCSLMISRNLSEESAYTLLRQTAMHRRLPIENIAASFLAGHEALRDVV